MSAAPGLARVSATDGRLLRRAVRSMPGIRRGLALTVVLGVIATGGTLVVPVTVQLTIDHGILAPGGPRIGLVAAFLAGAAVLLVLTAFASALTTIRLTRATEEAISSLRVTAFRHVHDLTHLVHAAEHRGSLLARVTADPDTISRLMEWGGLGLLISLLQVVVVLIAMSVYSWQLTLVVVACTIPLIVALRWFQRRLRHAYGEVRERLGRMLTAVGESVVGAAVVRAYRVEDVVARRVGEAVEMHRKAEARAGRVAAGMFSSGDIFAGVVSAALVWAGVSLGAAGEVTTGTVVAFLFLATLFVEPVQIATESVEMLQSALAGWRRILQLLETPPQVTEPADGVDLSDGPIGARFEGVGYRYPDGPPVLAGIDVEIRPGSNVAVVGHTGSGKTTFAKLLVRLIDPVEGRVLLGGAPLDRVRFASLRRRTVMIPQESFLFDGTILDNLRYGRPGATPDEAREAFAELGLDEWLSSLSEGVDTPVGERGSWISAGERQLVSLARSRLAAPELLVLDEATSAVDPGTESRIQRALAALTEGRTTLVIAHRLSTAQAAEEVLVFERGRLVERGTYDDLVAAGGVLAGLHTDWARTSPGGTREAGRASSDGEPADVTVPRREGAPGRATPGEPPGNRKEGSA